MFQIICRCHAIGLLPVLFFSFSVFNDVNFFSDCLDSGSLVPVQYFHRPIKDSNCSAGAGVVIGITNYQVLKATESLIRNNKPTYWICFNWILRCFQGYERQYIVSVAESLGMISQEIFAKRDKNEAKKSTHLVTIESRLWRVNNVFVKKNLIWRSIFSSISDL